MLHEHGIDLGDSNGIADGWKTKEVGILMGGGKGRMASLQGARKQDERNIASLFCMPILTVCFEPFLCFVSGPRDHLWPWVFLFL